MGRYALNKWEVERRGIHMKRHTALFIALTLVFCLLCHADVVEAKTNLNRKKVTITVGDKVTLKVKGTKKKPKWSSKNKKIATVTKNGKVTAKKPGTTTITAKLGKKKYRCMVTVTAKSSNSTGDSTQENTTATTEAPGNQTPTSEEPSTPQPDNNQPDTELPDNNPPEVSDQTPGTSSEDTKNTDAGEYSIETVHTGEGTYYEKNSTGAANLDYLEASFYTAAMNHEDYMNGLAGAYIEITDKDGDQIHVVITDRLPEGKKGDIDLTKSAFEQIEPLVTGRMAITWKIVPFPTEGPIQYVFKPTSTQWWAEVQVRNHRYPIKKLEYYDAASSSYVELPRQEYNYFTAASGMGTGPYTFRVTDFYGHVLIDTGIQMNATETPVSGAANFPY